MSVTDRDGQPHARTGAAPDRAARPGAIWWICLAAAGLPLSAVLLATLGLGIPPRAILGDAATYAGLPPYLGLLSNAGLLGWWTAAVAGLLAALALPPGRAGMARGALAAGGALSALLGIDDLTLLHEEVLPALLGLRERTVLLAYGLAILAYLWRFRAFHLGRDRALLATAVGLLGLSAAVDLTVDNLPSWIEWAVYRRAESWFGLDLPALLAAPDRHGMTATDHRRILEDGSKLAGITAWACYHARAALRVLRQGRG